LLTSGLLRSGLILFFNMLYSSVLLYETKGNRLFPDDVFAVRKIK
jgi:hypothetical protein